MKIAPHEYEELRRWLLVVQEVLFPALPSADVSDSLEKMVRKSPALARRGLAMAMGDMIEMAFDRRDNTVADIERELRDGGLPGFRQIVVRFSHNIEAIRRRGRIRTEPEYYAVRNAAEMADGDAHLWDMLAAYRIGMPRPNQLFTMNRG